MNLNNNELEKKYCKFKDENSDSKNEEFVEYIGVNFSDDVNIQPVFKAYYTTTKSMENTSSILQPLIKRDMIHALNKIDDTINKKCIRYEIGLNNRNNSNMKFVYKWISDIFPDINKYSDEVEKFCNIKCSDFDEYKYAALYFVGLIADLEQKVSNIKAIKMHYILRQLKDPNKIGKNFIVDNNYYLNTLYNMEVLEIKKISTLVRELIEKTNSGELWIAAVDYFKNGNKKYKIYFKKFSKLMYNAMIEIFKKMGCINLAEQINIYAGWINLHSELETYGIAICLDSNDIWSVNFYH